MSHLLASIEIIEVKVLLADQSRSQEDISERSGYEHFPEVNKDFPVSLEVNELLKRMKELENENSLLIEDNHEHLLLFSIKSEFSFSSSFILLN